MFLDLLYIEDTKSIIPGVSNPNLNPNPINYASYVCCINTLRPSYQKFSNFPHQ